MLTADELFRQSPAAQAAFLDALTDEEAVVLDFDWSFWGRADQQMPQVMLDLSPTNTVNTWLLMAGRGFGKTRVGAEIVNQEAEAGRARRIALIGETAADIRDVIVEGESGIIAKAKPWFKPVYEPSKRKITWPNGALAFTYNATEPDQLRGPQHDFLWGDELCLIAGTRVLTNTGWRNIESLCIGDIVLSSAGWQPVRNAGMTSSSAEVYDVTFNDGTVLSGTYGHPVYSLDRRAFVAIGKLSENEEIDHCRVRYLPRCGGTASHGTSWMTTGIVATGEMSDAILCTMQYGSRLMDQFLLATRSITRTLTRPIRSSRIFSALQSLSTEVSTLGLVWGGIVGLQSGVATTPKRMSGASVNLSDSAAKSAEWSSSRQGCEPSSATRTAERQTPDVDVRKVLSVRQSDRRQPVYNIEVDGSSDYYANGIRVHNCKWRYLQDTFDNAQMGLRLGQHPRQIFTTTPRPLKQIRDLIADPATIVTRGNTFDNARNLAPTFIAKIRRRYEGTRYGRQELYAEILDDMPGALWTRALIEACYLRPYETTPFPIHLFRRIVIGVDPAVSNNEGSDETGIVVAGTRVQDDHMVVIDDASGRYSPIEWAQKVVKLYRQYKADKIVAEVNNGGDLVETTLRIVDPNLPVKKVHARKGKFTRAEPISALYERGEAHHLGAFPILEDQLCQFTSDLDVKSLGYSPDRADAMVWAATELKVEEGDGTAVIEFYRGLVSGKKNDLVFPPL